MRCLATPSSTKQKKVLSIPPPLDILRCRYQDAEGRRSRAFSSPLWSLVSTFKFTQFCSTHRVARLPGASGTGRTTFVNTLCESDVLSHKECDSPDTAHVEDGIRIKPATVGQWSPFVVSRIPLKLIRRTRGRWHSHLIDHCRHTWFW